MRTCRIWSWVEQRSRISRTILQRSRHGAAARKAAAACHSHGRGGMDHVPRRAHAARRVRLKGPHCGTTLMPIVVARDHAVDNVLADCEILRQTWKPSFAILQTGSGITSGWKIAISFAALKALNPQDWTERRAVTRIRCLTISRRRSSMRYERISCVSSKRAEAERHQRSFGAQCTRTVN